MFPLVKKTVSALFVSTLLASAPAFADIIISGTRIIYNADKKMLTFVWKIKGIALTDSELVGYGR